MRVLPLELICSSGSRFSFYIRIRPNGCSYGMVPLTPHTLLWGLSTGLGVFSIHKSIEFKLLLTMIGIPLADKFSGVPRSGT